MLKKILLCGLVMVMAAQSGSGQTSQIQPIPSVFEVNKRLARTVNFGNALEAPTEGQWGLRLREEYFEVIQKAGFTAVRVPIKWSAHAEAQAPYKITRDFWLRIDWVIQQAKKNHLGVILDFHNYDELISDPSAHKDRWLGLWAQIAERYKNQPEDVVFELLNEPNGKLEAFWNDYFASALAVVRQSNPDRAVIVGPVAWNNAEQLKTLELPDDANLILTFHNYTPFTFTHQGAEWWSDGAKYKDITWTATPAQQLELRKYMGLAAQYAQTNNRPVFMGEFGAYSKGDMDSRARWTRFVREEAEAQGFTWGYWEFGAGFGVFDRIRNEWRKPLLEALLK